MKLTISSHTKFLLEQRSYNLWTPRNTVSNKQEIILQNIISPYHVQENNTSKRQDISWNWKLKIPGHVRYDHPQLPGSYSFVQLRPSDNRQFSNTAHGQDSRFRQPVSLFRFILRRKIWADGHNSIEISWNVVSYWLYQIYWIFPPSMTIRGDSSILFLSMIKASKHARISWQSRDVPSFTVAR